MAANLGRLRRARGLSLRQLSAVLAETQPINPDGLNRAEKGTRQVTTDELVALAAALRVNPTALLLPSTTSGHVEVSGVGSVETAAAWAWMDGRRPLVIPEDDDGEAEADFVEHARGGARAMYDIDTKAGRRRIGRNLETTPGYKVAWSDDGEVVEITREVKGRWLPFWPLEDEARS